jgi:hypothetical protein
MQQRLRSGQTIEEVARVAGVAEEWIARFAVPIQAEQSLIINRALDLAVNKQRVGPSSQPLGTSVWWNLQDRGAKLSEEDWNEGWSAFLVRDQVWVVQFAYSFRKKRQVAEWEVDLRGSTLHTRNRLATDLGYIEPGRRRRPGPPKPMPGGLVSRPAPSPAPEPATESDAPARSRAKPARRPTKKAVKKPAKKSRPAAKKSAAKKKPAAKRSTRPAAVKRRPARKAAPKRAATAKSTAAKKRAPAKKATAAKRAGSRRGATRKAATKRPSAKKARPSAATPVLTPRHTESPAATPVAPNRPSPVIAGAQRAGSAVGGGPPSRPAFAAAPARRRPVDDEGRPIRRREPLRADS